MKIHKSIFFSILLMVLSFGFSSCNKDDDTLQLDFRKNITTNEIGLGEILEVVITPNKSCTVTMFIDGAVLKEVSVSSATKFVLPTYQAGTYIMTVKADDGETVLNNSWSYTVK